jgi:hypothetical protein
MRGCSLRWVKCVGASALPKLGSYWLPPGMGPYGACTLEVKSVLNENVGGILGDTQY